MAQQEKETKIQRKKRRKQSEPTPLDLTSEILLRLPTKSVLRSRSVSKLWSSISTDPSFTNSFQKRSSIHPSLLVCIQKGNDLFVLSFPNHNRNSNKSYICSDPIDRYHMRIPNFSFSNPADSVNGLICFEEELGKPIIFNPSTRQLVTLSKPEKRWRKGILVFLGYDPVDGKHKVLCMPRGEICKEVRVLTLGSSSAQESWRPIKIKTDHKHYPLTGSNCCINGVLFYVAIGQGHHDEVVMSFDFRSEKFHLIEIFELSIPPRFNLINYEGRLACAINNGTLNNDGCRLWILEDAKKHKWFSKEFSVPSSLSHHDYDDDDDEEAWWKSSLDQELKGITDAGEFIYAPSVFHKSFHILFGDPEKNTFRKLKCKGIADDEFMAENGVQYEIRIFPHHIESLCNT